jgi:hypothetical protein
MKQVEWAQSTRLGEMMHHEGVVNMWVKCQPSQLGEQCCKESRALLLNFIHNVVILLECIRYVCYVL